MNPLYPGYVSEYDVAVLILQEDPIARGLTPIRVNCRATSLVGEIIQIDDSLGFYCL